MQNREPATRVHYRNTRQTRTQRTREPFQHRVVGWCTNLSARESPGPPESGDSARIHPRIVSGRPASRVNSRLSNGELMKEPELRLAVYTRMLPRRYCTGDTGRVFQELILGESRARIDIAVAAAHLHGFELKSEADTLDRLMRQQQVYSLYFEKMTLVADVKHCEQALDMIPDWWGLVQAHRSQRGGVNFTKLRSAGMNPAISPFHLVTLLWDNEMVDVLDSMGLAKGFRSKPCYVLWHKLYAVLKEAEIRAIVKQKLRARPAWSTVQLQM